MKYCIRCGNLVDGAPYCTQCGAKTDQPQTDVYGIAPSDYNVNPYADPQTNPYAYTSQLSRATYTGPDYDSWIPSFTEAFVRFWTAGSVGRAGRTEFWFAALWQLIFFIPCMAVVGLVMENALDGVRVNTAGQVIIVLVYLYSLAVVIKLAFLAARRLHDLGLTGWLWLLMLVFGWIFIIVIGIIPSQQGDNQYGKQPFVKKPFVNNSKDVNDASS